MGPSVATFEWTSNREEEQEEEQEEEEEQEPGGGGFVSVLRRQAPAHQPSADFRPHSLSVTSVQHVANKQTNKLSKFI